MGPFCLKLDQLALFKANPRSSDLGIQHPEMGIPHPDQKQSLGMPAPEMGKTDPSTYFLDFSPLRGLAVAIDDGKPFIVSESLRQFIEGYSTTSPKSGDTIILETNFEMHRPKEHNLVIDCAKEMGIELRVIALRASGKRYKTRIDIAAGNKETENEEEREALIALCTKEGIQFHDDDDCNAVEAIRWAVRDGTHLAAPRYYEKTDLSDIEQFNRLRTASLLDWNNEWVQEKLSWFPLPVLFRREHPEVASVIIQDTNLQRHSSYTISLLLLWVIAAEESKTRNEFDRRVGYYEHGYPSIFRSTGIRRGASLAKRNHKNLRGASYGINPEGKVALRQGLSLMRKASRTVFHMVKHRD